MNDKRLTVTQRYEAEIVEGLEIFTVEELREKFGQAVEVGTSQNGLVQFEYTGHAGKLLALKSVTAVYRVHSFDVPRPKALLGHQNFQTIMGIITQVQGLYHRSDFETLYIDAAGADSSVLVRLKNELAVHARVAPSDEKGDLHIRVRRSLTYDNGWDVLVRLSPRPLVTRAWRVCNYEGALNATLAHVMCRLLARSAPQGGHMLNLLCGSGSLMVEWLQFHEENTCFGVDHLPSAIACAEENLNASRCADRAQVYTGEATRTPLQDGSYMLICADLPFGQLIGSHEANRTLYPDLLAEAYRVAASGALFVLITHEIRLFELVLPASGWQLEAEHKVMQRGLHPRIYVLRKP